VQMVALVLLRKEVLQELQLVLVLAAMGRKA
jgi:hypothetical protein